MKHKRIILDVPEEIQKKIIEKLASQLANDAHERGKPIEWDKAMIEAKKIIEGE